MTTQKKKVAALVTEYRRLSHADMIVGKILEGYSHDGGVGPNLQLVSLYVDQFPPNDWSRGLAKKHGFKIHDNIPAALTLGGKELAVEGVLSIGEHGKYPTNSRGQTLYPRRKFLEEIIKTFEKCEKTAPVFNDKHLGPTWDDAKWMYDKAREMFIPFLAGSTIPLMWRKPPMEIPKRAEILEAVSIGYGPVEGYGFHAIEGLQCMVERRRGYETGVKAVQALTGDAMWKSLDQGRWSKALLEAAVKLVPLHANGDYRAITAKAADACVIFIEYKDGLRATVPIMNGWMYEGEGGGFTFSAQFKGRDQPVATQFHQQLLEPMGHFNYQLKAIESMLQTGHAPFPVERTLLTSGILDAAMTSLAEKNRRVETPHLAIKYEPTDWPYATDPLPKLIKRRMD